MNSIPTKYSQTAERCPWQRHGWLPPMAAVFLIGAVSLSGNSLSLAAVAFEAHGYLKRTTNNRLTRDRDIYEAQFAVFVRDCNWLIRITPFKRTFADYWEAGIQERRAMLLEVFESQIKGQRAEGKEVGENIAQGYVLPTEVPRYEGFPEFPVLWALFGSACYFENVKTNRVESILLAGQPVLYPTELENLQLASWTLQLQPPCVPNKLVLFNEGFVRIRSPQSGQIETHRFPPPYDKGFTSALLQVLATRTINELSLPVEASLQIFRPVEGAQESADLRVGVEYRIKVTNVLADCSISSFTPTLFPKTMIEDMRFAREPLPIDVVRYEVSEKWLTDAQVKLTKDYARAESLAKTRLGKFEPSVKPKSRLPIFFIFGLLTVLVIFAMLSSQKQVPTVRQERET